MLPPFKPMPLMLPAFKSVVCALLFFAMLIAVRPATAQSETYLPGNYGLGPLSATAANNVTVNVQSGASAGVLLGLGGTAMSLTGNNVTLNNAGTVDPSLLGLLGLLSSGTLDRKSVV